jgi:hypothetical protein
MSGWARMGTPRRMPGSANRSRVYQCGRRFRSSQPASLRGVQFSGPSEGEQVDKWNDLSGCGDLGRNSQTCR